VTDDGLGLLGRDSAGRPGGTGLESMRERAEEVGGELWLAEAQPRGTIVRAELPLRGVAPA
jgi:signal transduction histidine kinase